LVCEGQALGCSATNLAALAEAATGAGLPHFVRDGFDAFHECGVLEYGFLRLRCADCGHDKLVAFSCNRRGFCPSCGARRMSPGRWCLNSRPPGGDGTAHIVMSPLEFMQRLAALVLRPKLNPIRFHGVLAPNAKLRALVVPNGPEQATGKSELTATESGCAHGRPARIS